MLILSRRKNESIIIDDHIRLTVVDVCGEFFVRLQRVYIHVYTKRRRVVDAGV